MDRQGNDRGVIVGEDGRDAQVERLEKVESVNQQYMVTDQPVRKLSGSSISTQVASVKNQNFFLVAHEVYVLEQSEVLPG